MPDDPAVLIAHLVFDRDGTLVDSRHHSARWLAPLAWRDGITARRKRLVATRGERTGH